MNCRRVYLRLVVLMIFHSFSKAFVYEDAMSSLEMKFEDEEGRMMKVNPQGPVNLLLGFLIHSIGLDYNMRMFSPKIDLKYIHTDDNENVKYKRSYCDDVGIDEFHKILLILFPSNGGSISVSSNRDGSFFKEITKDDKKDGVKFMALVVASSLGRKLIDEVDLSDKSLSRENSIYRKRLSGHKAFVEIPPYIKFTKKKSRFLQEIVTVLQYFNGPKKDAAEDKKLGFYQTMVNLSQHFSRMWERFSLRRLSIDQFLESNNFLLQSFLFQLLDNKEKIQLFFNTLFDIVKGDKRILNECFVPVEYEDKTNYRLVKYVVEEIKTFPFSELNPPPAYAIIPAFSRLKDKFLNQKFNDCAEFFLLEFLCCLFYDSEKQEYTIDHLKHPSKDLRVFFNKRISLFSFDQECREEWSKVVGDLDDPRIVYKNKYSNARNEIAAGFLNSVLVLNEVLNLNVNNRLLKLERTCGTLPDNKEEVIGEFIEMFDEIISILKHSDKVISTEYNYLEINMREKDASWDIFGEVKIFIDVKKDFKVEVRLSHEPKHAEVNVKTNFHTVIMGDYEILNDLLNSNNILDLLIGKYVCGLGSVSEKEMERLAGENIYNVFFHGALKDDYYRVRAINILYNRLKDERNRDTAEKIERVIKNIIANSSLSIQSIAAQYRRFFFINETFLEDFLELLPEKDRLWALSDAIGSEIGEDIVTGYLARHDVSLLHDDKYLNDLTYNIVCKDRWDLLKTIPEKAIKCSKVLVYGFGNAIHLERNDFAEYFFKVVRSADIMETEIFKVNTNGLLGFLKKVVMRYTNMSRAMDLEKLYCWCFFSFDTESLMPLLEHTYSSSSLPIGSIYDYMILCPSIHSFDFYYLLLTLTIRENQKTSTFFGLYNLILGLVIEERKKLKAREDELAMIECLIEFCSHAKNKVNQETVEKSRKVNELIDEIKKKRLTIYRSIVPNIDTFKRLISSYLSKVNAIKDVSLQRQEHKKYVSNLNLHIGRRRIHTT